MSLLERLLPAPGEVITDRYELRDELGRGGFGVVYRAIQLGLNESVAIKILLPHVLENEEIASRFEREVNIAKSLRHPNTIRILDYSRTAKGLPFYVMELVRGDSLEDVLEAEACLSPARTRRIVVQLLKSLGEAHSIGIIHRDLKPANLILSEIYGEPDFVKVLDFGIAKALTSQSGVSQTQTGMIVGTPAYMSPEQALGHKGIDGRADLYGVGLILAECLMGRRVVEGETPYVVVAQHASVEPLQYPTALMQSPLWPIIAHATAKDPADRFPDAAAMRAELEALGSLSKERDPELVALASSDQPLPSSPGITPGSSAVSAQRRVLGGDHRSRTITAESSALGLDQPSKPHPSGMGRALLVLVLIGTVVAGVIFAISAGGGGTTPEAMGGPTGQASLAADGPQARRPDEVATPPTAGLDPERAAAVTALAIAGDRLTSALPDVRSVRFEGEGITVLLGDTPLGVTPFETPLPRIDARLELSFQREGFRGRTREVSLLDDAIDVSLRRRRDEPTGPTAEAYPSEPQPFEPEPTAEDDDGQEEDSTAPSPFGLTPIHD